MDKDLYYVIENGGYHIYDRNDPYFHIHQYGNYIPDSSKSYEENAQAQIDRLNYREPEQEVESLDNEDIKEVD